MKTRKLVVVGFRDGDETVYIAYDKLTKSYMDGQVSILVREENEKKIAEITIVCSDVEFVSIEDMLDG